MSDTASQPETPQAAPPAPAPAKPAGPTVKVRVAWPVDTFDTGIDGVGVLTQEFSDIPQPALAAVLEVARKHQIVIVEEAS